MESNISRVSIVSTYRSTRNDRFAPQYLRHSLRQTLGAKLKLLRVTLGVKKHWVARRAKVSIPTIFALEQGWKTDECVTVGSLYRIAKAVHYNLIVLDGKDDEITEIASMPLEELIAQKGITFHFIPIP